MRRMRPGRYVSLDGEWEIRHVRTAEHFELPLWLIYRHGTDVSQLPGHEEAVFDTLAAARKYLEEQWGVA